MITEVEGCNCRSIVSGYDILGDGIGPDLIF